MVEVKTKNNAHRILERETKKQVGKMGVGEVGAPPRQQTGTNCRDFEYRECFISRARFFCRLSSIIHTTKSKRKQNAFESGHSLMALIVA